MISEFIRNHLILVIAGALLLAVNIAVCFFFSLPNINAEVAGKRRLTEELAKSDREFDRLLGLRQARRDLLARRQDLQLFYETYLGGDKGSGQTDLVRERSRIERGLGVQPDRVSYPGSDVRDQPLKRLSMSFTLEGNYLSLRKFIHSIENSRDFFLIIDSIKLDEKSGGGLQMSITVSTYFHIQGEVVEEEAEGEL